MTETKAPPVCFACGSPNFDHGQLVNNLPTCSPECGRVAFDYLGALSGDVAAEEVALDACSRAIKAIGNPSEWKGETRSFLLFAALALKKAGAK